MGQVRYVWAGLFTVTQSGSELCRAPCDHIVPALDKSDSRQKMHCNLEKPRGWTDGPEHGASLTHTNDNVMPLLLLKHAEALTHRPIGHGIEAEPSEQISQVHNLSRLAGCRRQNLVEPVEVLASFRLLVHEA